MESRMELCFLLSLLKELQAKAVLKALPTNWLSSLACGNRKRGNSSTERDLESFAIISRDEVRVSSWERMVWRTTLLQR